jgi:hypothetical protein
MGRLTPNSTLKLYRNVRHMSEKNNMRIIWQSPQNREAYFNSKCVYTKTVQIVKKRKNAVKVSLRDVNGGTLENCNYLSFKNPHYDNKLYYARIIDKDYMNDGTAIVTFKIEWWLTDMFDMAFADMSIDREHMSQADALTAATNPYTGNILEMRTAEPGLAVSEDLQKQVYEIGGVGDTQKDGLYVMQTLTSIGSQDYTNYLMYLSPIDLDALAEEGVTPTPATWFASLLNRLSHTPKSFFVDVNGDTILSTESGWAGKKWSNKLPNPYYVLGFSSRDTEQTYTFKNLIDKLTSWNCVSSILAMYGVPENHMEFFMYSGSTVESAAPKQIQYSGTGLTDNSTRSPKLACYPFSYLKVESPSGDVKEFHYENFDSVREGNSYEKFSLIGDLAEKPRIALVPVGYKEKYTSHVQNPYGNFNEALMFEQYATVSYVTDAWLAQIAAVSAQAIQSNTIEAMGYRDMKRDSMVASRNADVLSLGNAVAGSDMANPAMAMMDIGGSVVGMMGSEQDRMNQANMLDLQEHMIKSAYSAITGDYEGAAIYENMAKTRPAYVAHAYHKSNGDGTILMNTAVNADFCIIRCRLADVIANQYSQYFKRFGYTSGRVGKPRAFNYLTGSTDASKLPDWQDGGDYKFTYVKTTDAKIMCEDLEAEVEISQMLNNGVRFVKGEELQ